MSRWRSFFYQEKRLSSEEELLKLDQKKLVLINALLRLGIQAVQLETSIANVRVKEEEMIHGAHVAQQEESRTDNTDSHRTSERVRFEQEEKRSILERKRWEMLDVLRETNMELRSLRNELLECEAVTATVEMKLEKHGLIKKKAAVGVLRKKVIKNSLPQETTAIAKRRIPRRRRSSRGRAATGTCTESCRADRA